MGIEKTKKKYADRIKNQKPHKTRELILTDCTDLNADKYKAAAPAARLSISLIYKIV